MDQIDKLANIIETYFPDIIIDSYDEQELNIRRAVLISKYPDEQLTWMMPVDAGVGET